MKIRRKLSNQHSRTFLSHIVDSINIKREHIKRLSNQNGAIGELEILTANAHFFPRPKGLSLTILLRCLHESGINVKKTSFDAIALPLGRTVDFTQIGSVSANLADMVFIEIKTAKQSRVRADFSGYFFALTEGELMAAKTLGKRRRVMLLNKLTGTTLLTSVPEIPARTRSTTWQVSVQL